jgi:hypothetical protein
MFKSSTVILVIGLAAVLLTACTLGKEQVALTGSGNLVTQEEPFSGFDKVSAGYSFKLEIQHGDTYRVVIRVDDNVAEYLKVEKDGKTLEIGLDPEYSYNIRNATLEAGVTMPELTELDLSGSSDANVTGFATTAAFRADLSGSSTLQGDIETGDASFDLSGSSDVTLTGSGGDVKVDASGSSVVDLSDFSVIDADIDVSGSSRATVNASGRLDAEASGASHVFYLGGPTLGMIDTSGSSSVERK